MNSVENNMGFKVMHHALNMYGTCKKMNLEDVLLNKTTLSN